MQTEFVVIVLVGFAICCCPAPQCWVFVVVAALLFIRTVKSVNLLEVYAALAVVVLACMLRWCLGSTLLDSFTTRQQVVTDPSSLKKKGALHKAEEAKKGKKGNADKEGNEGNADKEGNADEEGNANKEEDKEEVGIDKEDIKNAIMAKNSRTIPVSAEVRRLNHVLPATASQASQPSSV